MIMNDDDNDDGKQILTYDRPKLKDNDDDNVVLA